MKAIVNATLITCLSVDASYFYLISCHASLLAGKKTDVCNNNLSVFFLDNYIKIFRHKSVRTFISARRDKCLKHKYCVSDTISLCQLIYMRDVS